MSVALSHLSRGLYAIKPRFQALLAPLADWLASRKTNPDALTYAALACGLVASAALTASQQNATLLWAIPPLIAMRLALNALDGMVATRRGVARPWGKVLNELCDRLADVAFFAPLLLITPLWASASLAAMLLVPFVGVLGETVTGTRLYGGSMGKADRMLCLGVAAAASAALQSQVPLQILPIVIVAGSLLTIVQRLERIHAAV